jgi:methyl-accepting chemotaxis protein
VLIPAAFIGLTVGRRISSPILRSVDYLRYNSESLAALASKQKSAAEEQMWVVEASQVGLKSVQYYNSATNVAIDSMSDIGTDLIQHWHIVDVNTVKHSIKQMVDASQYIKKAVQYQDVTNEKLATAINVTTQVSEQLDSGAKSAIATSNQLRQVVDDLREVVGK